LFRQDVLGRDKYVLQHDHAGDGGAEGKFAFDFWSLEAFGAAFQNEASDFAGIVLCPYQEDVGDRGIGDPGF
jgi:hypothetical protein